MDKKDKMFFVLLEGMYYLTGVLEGISYKGDYDFIWNSIDEAEKLLKGEDDESGI